MVFSSSGKIFSKEVIFSSIRQIKPLSRLAFFGNSLSGYVSLKFV
jgi:hypothetical protein